jgi:hypothetical protein
MHNKGQRVYGRRQSLKVSKLGASQIEAEDLANSLVSGQVETEAGREKNKREVWTTHR